VAVAVILSDRVRRSSEHVGLLSTGNAECLICAMAALSQCLKRRQSAQSVILGQQEVQNGPRAEVGQSPEYIREPVYNFTRMPELQGWVAPVIRDLDAEQLPSPAALIDSLAADATQNSSSFLRR